jgi:dsRNA-specific ribonuclease
MNRPKKITKKDSIAARLVAIMLGKGKPTKTYRANAVIGNSHAPRHVQDAIIADANAKRVRRGAARNSAYAVANAGVVT